MTSTDNEKTLVELPFIEQLKGLGWKHSRGDEDVPYLTGRDSFREILLKDRLREAIQRINPGEDGEPWLDDARIEAAASALERVSGRLMEANETATHLLLKGTVVEGDPDLHGGHNQTVRYIDFDHPERNDFLVVDQFRVEAAGCDPIIPDLVLFVNGIPLVVVECKSPSITDPMEAGIDQLLRYSNNRPHVDEDEGVEKLFYYNQFMVSTSFYEARAGTVGAAPEHYLEWKDTSPIPMDVVAQDLGVESLKSQQTLIAGMLRPENLLSIVRNFVLHTQVAGKTVKIATRYQQFRAVQKAIKRLQTGETRQQTSGDDERGGGSSGIPKDRARASRWSSSCARCVPSPSCGDSRSSSSPTAPTWRSSSKIPPLSSGNP